jgi:hypothetical protein
MIYVLQHKRNEFLNISKERTRWRKFLLKKVMVSELVRDVCFVKKQEFIRYVLVALPHCLKPILFPTILRTLLFSATYLPLYDNRPKLVFFQILFLNDASCILSQRDTWIFGLKKFRPTLYFIPVYILSGGTRWRSGWGTALQTWRSRVWFPMVSLEYIIDIILPITVWSSGWLSL